MRMDLVSDRVVRCHLPHYLFEEIGFLPVASVLGIVSIETADSIGHALIASEAQVIHDRMLTCTMCFLAS
jgi:hypothetical protein